MITKYIFINSYSGFNNIKIHNIKKYNLINRKKYDITMKLRYRPIYKILFKLDALKSIKFKT